VNSASVTPPLESTLIRLDGCRKVAILMILGISTAFLNGCATTKITQKSPLILPDSLLEANKRNVDGLYKSWIMPFTIKKYGSILHENRQQLSASEEAVRDGFSRFCSTSEGEIFPKKERYGDKYRCTAPSGTFIGEFTATRFTDDSLLVKYDSPEQVERRESWQREYKARKAQNGPTGWIVTNEGKFRFLRIGNLRERHVIEMHLGYDSNEYVPIEEVLSITFHAKCCDFDVTLKDGRTKTLTPAHLGYRTPSAFSSYSGGSYGLPIVVVDPDSGQPYTRIFPNLTGLRSIEFERNNAIWSSLPASLIETKLEVISQTRLNQYVSKLRLEANQLYSEAEDRGWILLLPDGKKLTRQLLNHLENELQGIANDWPCRGDVVHGLTSLETPLRCRVASRELKLVVEKGYSLVTDVTPLSSIIVLKKIKEESER